MGTYTSLTYHIVFGTKFRRPTITKDIRDRIYGYIAGTVQGLEGHLSKIGGVEDHVHLLLSLPPTIALSNAVRDIKANSSKWIRGLSTATNQFEWQIGYGAFTVSISQFDRVTKYLESQEVHHRKKSYEEEYIEFLKRHRIEFERDQLFEKEFAG